MKLHHLLQKYNFFLIKLAALAAGRNSEPQPATSSAVSNIEYRTAACDELSRVES
jgi:hypothetical protein